MRRAGTSGLDDGLSLTPMNARDDSVRRQVRTYYRTVSRYIEKELLERDDRAFWIERVRRAGHPAVLELGCGTGRVTEALGQEAERVVGVDLSPEMLQKARRRLQSDGNVHLVLADMRTLRLARPFRLVVAANDPFTHLVEDADRRRALETVAHHLEPGAGRFVLDAHWLGEERLRRAATPEGLRRERTVDLPGSELRIREHWRCDVETRRCTVRYEYHEADGTMEGTSFRARLWSVDEVRLKLDRAGLRVRTLWGGFDGRPFEPAEASHLIVEAERR